LLPRSSVDRENVITQRWATESGPAAPARTLHVLTLTPFFPHAGDDACGCFIAEPLRLMPQFGINSTVIAVQPFHRHYYRPPAFADGAEAFRYLAIPGNLGLSSSGAFLYARLLPDIRRLHREQPIDLIHAHVALPCGNAAAMIARSLAIPFVVSVHGLDAFATNQVHGLFGRWCAHASRNVYRSATSVICVSGKVRQQIAERMDITGLDLRVVYNGADPLLFSPAPDREESDLILSVGNLDPIKGHELVVRAVQALKGSHPSLRCEIIGTGPEMPRLKTLARDLGISESVIFLGRQSRSEVAKRMQRCALFVLPSRYEAIGCVYLEAMACAKPAIGCYQQGISEIIHHREDGWLVQPGNLPDLVQGLATLLGDNALRNRLGEAGRRTVSDRLTIAHQAEAWARIYRDHIQ